MQIYTYLNRVSRHYLFTVSKAYSTSQRVMIGPGRKAKSVGTKRFPPNPPSIHVKAANRPVTMNQVHIHVLPQKPRTFLPVRRLNMASRAAPTPERTKNAVRRTGSGTGDMEI